MIKTSKQKMKYKKPIVIEAVRWMTDNWDVIADFLSEGDCSYSSDGRSIFIEILEGTMEVKPFDYIVRRISGEYYSVKPEAVAIHLQNKGGKVK